MESNKRLNLKFQTPGQNVKDVEEALGPGVSSVTLKSYPAERNQASVERLELCNSTFVKPVLNT